jgi:hypothetical protein
MMPDKLHDKWLQIDQNHSEDLAYIWIHDFKTIHSCVGSMKSK